MRGAPSNWPDRDACVAYLGFVVAALHAGHGSSATRKVTAPIRFDPQGQPGVRQGHQHGSSATSSPCRSKSMYAASTKPNQFSATARSCFSQRSFVRDCLVCLFVAGSDYSDRLLQQPLSRGSPVEAGSCSSRGSPVEAGSCSSRGGVGSSSNTTAIWSSFMFRRELQDEFGRKIVLAHWS